jgi:hypothetical protein
MWITIHSHLWTCPETGRMDRTIIQIEVGTGNVLIAWSGLSIGPMPFIGAGI